MAKPKSICSVEGCGKFCFGHGYCVLHYKRWRRHGNATAGRAPNGSLWAFINNVAIPYIGAECLLWPYGRMPSGYADVWDGKRKVLVHRVVCEAVHGAPPHPDHEAAHLCGGGKLGCVAPRHLQWKTHAENMADTLVHGTHNRGERSGSAKLTEDQVREIRALCASEPVASIARRYSVSIGTIYHIRCGTTWRHLDEDQR